MRSRNPDITSPFATRTTTVVCAVLCCLFRTALAEEPRLIPEQERLTWRGVSDEPLVPLQKPRPPEGDGPEDQWQISRADADAAPVARFLDSLRGNDAVIRIPLGQARLLTTKSPIAEGEGEAFIGIADPSIADFEVLPNPRMIRLVGLRPGTTDLSFATTDDQTYGFEIQVVYDLELIRAKLQQTFPGAAIDLTQIRDHVVLQGLARSPQQLQQIESALSGYLASVSALANSSRRRSTSANLDDQTVDEFDPDLESPESFRWRAGFEQRDISGAVQQTVGPQIINLMTIPGVQQVLLQVRVAELNRTGMREVGADTFFEFGPGNILGSKIGGANVSLNGLTPGSSTTGFGVFPTARMEIMLSALRDNSLLRILAEPNLVALSGHEASFLAGGEFPVPIPQGSSLGVGTAVTVSFKEFGVQLNFVPHILDDDEIRLEVRPEVSTIDESLGTTLVVGGDPVPGVNTRRVHTTVKLREGETLALAGLLQVTLDASTERIPGLGDVPYLGPLFSNNSHSSVEKELLVLVTPYLVSPLPPNETVALPGSEIQEPNDLEFYLLNRIEGRTGKPFRSTTAWDDPLGLVRKLKLERDYVCGPSGFTK